MNFEIAPNAVPMCEKLFGAWRPIIEAHKDSDNTEIEFRFGRKAAKGFDTNVGPENFAKVLKALEKYTGWEDKKHTNSTVYYFEGSKRLIVDEETDEQVGQIKKRVAVNDFQIENLPLDVRLGISTEIPFEYDGEETSTKQKTKERWSFVRKNLSIDMSIIRGDPDDKDSDDDTVYQIELEIVSPGSISSPKELFNILHKVFDVLNCVPHI
jgi:hypothetical protein